MNFLLEADFKQSRLQLPPFTEFTCRLCPPTRLNQRDKHTYGIQRIGDRPTSF
jgi:hypothetical protein